MRVPRAVPVFGALLLLAGCVSARPTPSGPVVSPTGIVYEEGTPPTETRYSQTATLYLNTPQVERALTQALEGVEADPTNPIHHYLAGIAHLRLGNLVEADRLFDEAQRIYPAYELDIEPEREAVWAEAFNAGLEAYARGDVEEAIRAWERAAAIYDLRPGAHRNLASVLVEEGRYQGAIRAYQGALEGLRKKPATRVLDEAEVQSREEIRNATEESLAQLLLFQEHYADAEPLLRRQLRRDSTSVRVRSDLAAALEGQGKGEEAAVVYRSLLSEDRLASTELFNLGVALFQAGRYEEAGDAFGRLTGLQPDSRDAWFNYANALFAAEAWSALVEAGPRLLELDPLNEDAQLIVARAHLEAGDREGAIQGVERVDSAPVYVSGLRMRPDEGGTLVEGRVVGNVAEPGTPVRLRFVFYGDSGPLGAETVSVPAPPPDETAAFEVSVQGRAAGYRYELVADASSGEGSPSPL